jgi:hypothetical protein
MSKKKKLKRKPKIILFLVLIIILIIGGVISYRAYVEKNSVKENKVVSKIPKYGYELKSNKSAAYKKLFQQLKDVLSEDKVNEKKYLKLISKMFILDFYSLADHNAKTDVGGVDFVHPDALDNFVVNAEDTLYKYVESNIYGQRDQDLPEVDKISIGKVEKTEFTYGDVTDSEAYTIKLNWTYKDEKVAKGYQNEAVLTFVHDDIKLVLVELSSGDEEDEDED